MAVWKYRIEGLKPIIDSYDGSNFIEMRDGFVATLKAQFFWAENPPGDARGSSYWYVVDEMADARNEDEFDAALNGLYDWGDDYRVWVGVAI